MDHTPTPFQRRIETALGRLSFALPGFAWWLAIGVALSALAIGWHWGTFAVGGSDSHCYVAQARMFAAGRLSLDPPLDFPVPWPNAPATFAPAGFIAKATPGGEAVPICPAGLPVLMAAGFELAGERGIFLIVPVLGALAVWSTFQLGRRLDGPIVGLVAAAWLVCSPIVLYQLVQPMSDVPAMAWWIAALACSVGPRRHPLLAGIAAGLAVMTRPNLAPLIIPVGGLLAISTSRSGWWRPLAWFAAAAAPGIAAVAVLQNAMYGSPFHSGYGSAGGLFSTSHIFPNLLRYPVWLFESHGPVVALALAAPFLSGRVREVLWLAAFIAGVAAAYLPYTVFEDWTYLRFLLPAFPVLLVLVARVVVRAVSALPESWRVLSVAVVILAIGWPWIHSARERAVFELQSLEQKYPVTGAFVRDRLPAGAVIFAGQESGSVRYYSQRPTLAWDAFTPESLDAAVAYLEGRGIASFLVLERWEEEQFLVRHRRSSQIGALDWPPVAEVGSAVRIYRADDRRRYLGGGDVRTDHVWFGRRGGR